MKKLFAFNLAEVVLVMGIIGAIGVLGVANAKKDTDTSEKIAQLKKTYEILDTAFTQAVMENGKVDTWGGTAAEIWPIISPYLKLTKNCGPEGGCWREGEIIRARDKQSIERNIDPDAEFQKGILANGVSIAIRRPGEEVINGIELGESLIILVDVNGKKGLNMLGNDVFGFWVDDLTDWQYVAPITERGERNDLIYESHDIFKSSWVLKYGNMDYLKKCGRENNLKWSSVHSCR